MRDKIDRYRERAAEGQRMADRSIYPVEKELWLRIAQGWLNLIQTSQRYADALTFTDRVEATASRTKI